MVAGMKVGIGQDSHRFDFDDQEKQLVLGGIVFEGEPPLQGNSDADVILHSITNAISGVTCVNILGDISDKLCLEQGITDSAAYLALAMADLQETGWQLLHVSLSIEAARPRLAPWIEPMRERLAALTGLLPDQIGLTATSGEGLTAFGRGEGIHVVCLVSARR